MFPLGLLWDSFPQWPWPERVEQRDQLAMKIFAFVPSLLLISALLSMLPRVGCTHLVVFKPATWVKLLYCKYWVFPGGMPSLEFKWEQLLSSLGIQIRKKKWKTSKIVLVSRGRKKTITYRVTFCCGFSEKYSHEFIHPHSGSPVCDVLCGDHNIFGRCRLSRKSLLTGRRFWIVIASIYFLFSLFFCFLCGNEIPSHYGLDPLGTISQNTAFSSLIYFLLEYYRYIIKATSALYSAKMFSIRYHY